MRIIFDAIVVSMEVMVMFFLAFLFVYLLALFLSPIENRLSILVWNHTAHSEQKVVPKSTFKQFSQRHR